MITEIIKTALRTNDNGNNMHKAQGLSHENAWKGSQVRENNKSKDKLIQQYLYAQGLTPSTPHPDAVCKKSRSGKQNNQIIEMEQV